MAVEETSHVQRILEGFATVLKSAACECFLILLLFVDAALAYTLTRFAHYCGLQSPCIVCSRLDHVFRNEEPGYYWNLFCSRHISEISSLISCNIHGKLVDGHSVCENCLSSHINLPCRLKCQTGATKIDDKSSTPAETRIGKTGFDPSSHVGFTELKITSESEHEIPSSDDEVCNCMVRDMDESKKISLVHSALETPSKRMYNNLDKRKQPDANEKYGFRCLHPGVLVDNDVCDNKYQLAEQKSNRSVLPGLISLDGIPASSCLEKVPSCSASFLSNLISLADNPTSVDVTENPHETSSGKLADVTEASKNESISINKNDKTLKSISTSSQAGFGTDRVVDDIVVATDEDPSDLHTSPAFVNKDRSLPVQNSSGEGIQLSFSNVGPELQGDGDDFDDMPNESNPYGVQSFHNYFQERSEFGSLGVNEERSLPTQNSSGEGIHSQGDCDNNDFETTDESNPHGVQSFGNFFTQQSDFGSLESLNESTFNEIEGEDSVDKLKRQNEHYRKFVKDLLKELEEERNASAIAANQAMAMITRLQEEKSALQMETLHYLRMMDEQADHDGDALDKANDLLAEKEKELQDLEAELEFYRLNFSEEVLKETLHEASINANNGYSSTENPIAKSAWSQFENEKLYIYECLRDLGEKVTRFAHHGTYPHISDGEYFDEAENKDQHQQEFVDEKDKHANLEVEGNYIPVQKASSASNGSVPFEEQSSTSISKDQVVSKGNSDSVSNGQKGSEDYNETGLASLENEISDLNRRLEALVADSKFLEDCLKSLQNGNEGLLFIQAIFQELRELRILGLRNRSMSVS
ncbi:probable myosin-binding protein 4 isoform X2 [Hibiscus syriacus]|uniref:probable myosin-binding protein 4 isoform X2 n=1 Tax=Hibiscus syriacus TaxID=106335 RepID=UPI0019233D72|nr:probable myosin-binding protein 4 isoform X2 [Hibiscus syriacus]